MDLKPQIVNHQLKISLKKRPNKDWSFRQSVLRAATDLGRKAQGSLVLLFSGGSDSEVVLKALLAARVKVKPLFIRIRGDGNRQEWLQSQRICSDLGLRLESRIFDLKDFIQSGEFEDLAMEMNSPLMAFAVNYKLHLELVQEGFFPVWASGDPYFIFQKCLWYYRELPWICAPEILIREKKLPGTSSFFFTRSEILASFMKDFFFQEALWDFKGKYSDSSVIKSLIYHEHFGVPLAPKVIPPYLLWEEVRISQRQIKRKLSKLGEIQPALISYSELLRTFQP